MVTPATTRLMRVTDEEKSNNHIRRRLYNGVFLDFGFPVWLKITFTMLRREIKVHRYAIAKRERASRRANSQVSEV